MRRQVHDRLLTTLLLLGLERGELLRGDVVHVLRHAHHIAALVLLLLLLLNGVLHHTLLHESRLVLLHGQLYLLRILPRRLHLLELLLLQQLLLRRHVTECLRIRRTARHALPAHALARRHATRVLSARHPAHRPVRARLHPHHGARLADVRLSGPGHAGLHHRLAHVLHVGRDARMTVGGHTRMLLHGGLRLVRHHLLPPSLARARTPSVGGEGCGQARRGLATRPTLTPGCTCAFLFRGVARGRSSSRGFGAGRGGKARSCRRQTMLSVPGRAADARLRLRCMG